MNVNIQGGIVNKRDDIELLLNKHNISVLCVSEHHLNQEIQYLTIGNFNTVNHFARRYLRKGGVAILVRSDIKTEVIVYNNSCELHFEMCAIECILPDDSHIIIAAIYRSPNGDHEIFMDKLSEMLENLYTLNCTHIICGDVNIDLLQNGKKSQDLKNILLEYNIGPSFIKPTRISSHSETCIDNIFTDSPGQRYEIYDTHLSDHTFQMVHFQVNLQTNKQTLKMLRFFNRDNIADFTNFLSLVNWQQIFESNEGEDVDVVFNEIYGEIKYAFEIKFPYRKCTNNYKVSTKNGRWMAPELRELSNLVKEMHQVNKRIRNPDYDRNYRELRSYYRKRIKKSKKCYNDDRLRRARNINRESWKIVRENRPNKHTAQIEVTYDGEHVKDRKIVCEIFNNFFIDVGNSKGAPQSLTSDLETVSTSIFLYPTTPYEIKNCISKVCQKNAPGIDEMPGSIFIAAKEILAEPFSKLINISFQQGKFPTALKSSKVMPVYKNKGSKHMVENYRPIALQCQISKIFETCFNSRLTKFLESNKILCREQNGFRAGYSTQTALDMSLQHIYSALNNKKHILGLFFDMSRAFDLVDHSLLLHKMEKMGIRGPANSWIESYLTGRNQKVVIDGIQSSPKEIKKGAPQGSCLSPTLFNCFINDLPTQNGLDVNFTLYADDTNALISGEERADVALKANECCSYVSGWCAKNGLMLNSGKTTVMEFMTKNTTTDSSILTRVESQSIENTSTTKFLGLYIDQKITWNGHIEYILPKLASCSFLIQSIRNTVSISVLKLVYYGLFQSILSYGLIYWGLASGTDRIFKAQKRVIRYISGASYNASCRELFRQAEIMTFPSLYIYSLLLYVRQNLDIFEKRSNFHSYATRNRDSLEPSFSRLSIGQENPRYIGLKLYNHALGTRRCFDRGDNLNTFKRKVMKYLKENCFYDVKDFLVESTPVIRRCVNSTNRFLFAFFMYMCV